jgi:hypothetical protein
MTNARPGCDRDPRRWARSPEFIAGAALVLLAACGDAPAGNTPASAMDGTPPNRSSDPQPTADSPPLGGAGGPGTGDSVGSGGGGITGTAVP